MDISHPHFEEPRWLLLALVAPLLLGGLQRYAALRRQTQLAQIASPRFVARLCRSHSPWRRGVKNLLLIGAFVAAGLALARPQWGELLSTDQWLGEDVVFAVDCSNSMLSTDARPNRLERAKLAILDFVRQHGRGRVGLVAFAGGSFLQCPLTLDYDVFETALRSLDDRTITLPGTDIGRALLEAQRAMPASSRRKLVLLVTDGEDLENSGVATARSLATNGVVVFTIGVGSRGGSEIPIVNATGQVELLRDANHELVHSQLDEKTLQTIAQTTGGHYYPLGPLGEGLSRVRRAVEELDASAGTTRTQARGVDRYYWPVTGILLALVAESLIGTRRRTSVALP